LVARFRKGDKVRRINQSDGDDGDDDDDDDDDDNVEATVTALDTDGTYTIRVKKKKKKKRKPKNHACVESVSSVMEGDLEMVETGRCNTVTI
jgi:hypothetical protein